MQKSTHRFCTGKRMPYRMVPLFVFMIGCMPFLLKAQSYKSLTDKIQLAAGKTNAAAVVKSLQQQTTYTFIYDPEYLKQCAFTAVKFENAPLSTVLQYLDNNAPLDIELTNNSTIAVRKGNAEKPAVRNSGRVTGKVVDNKNEPLPGVTIQVQGGTGVVSNVDGSYELQLEPGKYTLTFSYISFESRQVTGVEVTTTGITPLNIVLKSAGSRLKEVTVTGNYKKASIEGLYALQKNNAAITDGISADLIARTPDKNVGEVLKRISGLSTLDNKYVVVRGLSERYNQAVLNGQVMPSTELNRKNFSFDIIPSNIIENITVIKTLTPDRSAEFGGGLVEVNTLDIPAENFLNISAGGSYNDKTTGKHFLSLPLDGKEYWARPSDHRKLLGKFDWRSKDDIIAAFNANDAKGNHFNNNWGITNFNAQPSQNYQVSIGRVLPQHGKGQFGIIASANYRNTLATQDVVMGRAGFEGNRENDEAAFTGKRYGFTTNLGGMAGIGYRDAKNRISFQSIYQRTLDQQLLLGSGATGTYGSSTYKTAGYFDQTAMTTLWQHQLRGEHVLSNSGIKLRWMGSKIKLDRQRPDNHILVSDYAIADATVPNSYNLSRPASVDVSSGALRSWVRALENNYTWDVSVQVPFKFNIDRIPLSNSFKAGYGGWSKDRLFYVFNTANGVDNSAGYYLPVANFFTPENGLKTTADRFGDNYHRTASLHAVYGMFDNKIGDKFRLVWGVRGEYYNLNSVNAALDSMFSTINHSRGDKEQYDYTDMKSREPNFRLFPSANLTYSLSPSMNLRLAYAESIIRPDLRELSSFKEYDFELGGLYVSSMVRSTTIKHYDFRYEWYPGPGEMVSFSAFYKRMAYPMEIYREASNNVFQLRNNKLAKNYGIEAEVRKSLRFTGVKILRDITLYGNFTYLDARVTPMITNFNGLDPNDPLKVIVTEDVKAEEKRPQSGASNYMVNAGFYYDTKPVSFSLVYNYVTNRMYRANEIYALGLFERPLEALDAQLAFHLLKEKAEVRLNVSNLLNSFSMVYRNRFDDDPAIAEGKKAPATKQLLYKAGTDAIDYKASPGRTFSITASYRF
ncbi:outer membrane receptor protein involved in Fe transport [Chitinophaga niastensis]|uniref:Outer membrane receptor protein involved in Fe transport n=1 Tax=Chitinophaga niastensis TaxID=536980 RepID=A0A2P8HU22_CHINA|nr:TonB-dependent receptor [Chitinophaga niastensis]PSL49726.1 outer membrane receptor protein involved in Fe transport [Chitinophaga niastensis]